MATLYPLLADTVLLLHALFVVFVVGALVLTLIGGYRRWRWVRNWRFRLIHLGAIAVVVGQAWVGLLCPLTTLELWLRQQAGDTAYAGGFIQYWLQRLLYYSAPDWVFVLLYSAFGLLVLLGWWRFPPQR